MRRKKSKKKVSFFIFLTINIILILTIIALANKSKNNETYDNKDSTNIEKDIQNNTYNEYIYSTNENTSLESSETNDSTELIITINNESIINRKKFNKGSLVTLKYEQGKDKISKILLVKLTLIGKVSEEESPKDITTELKNEGYTLNETGVYTIQVFNENEEQINGIGTNIHFRVE